MKRVLKSQLLLAMILSVLSVLMCPASKSEAAITAIGDVSPSDPTTWAPSTVVYIGNSANGTVTVDGGSNANNWNVYLGYEAGSSGIATVRGAGTFWYISNLHIGESGSGILNIEAGAQVGYGGCYLGYNSGSNGTAVITGTDSLWTIFDDLYVGYQGSGTLTVKDGGIINDSGTLYASLKDIYGNGTISTNGAVLDADIFFDSVHGSQPSISFGSGGILNLFPKKSSKSNLGVGYKGNGTLKIADGIAINSDDGFLGLKTGSNGIATVTGTGSKWNATRLFVGDWGSGSINIEAGGQVILDGSYDLGYQSGSFGILTVTGAGSNLTSNRKYNYYSEIGFSGSGSLNITDGGQVQDGTCEIGCNLGSTGTVTVTGTGSTWSISKNLYVGYSGNAKLNIEAGGQVNTYSGCWMGYNSGSTAAATVTGIGSKWTIYGSLFNGVNGSGTLTVTDGGTVVAGVLCTSLKNLYGNGTISTKGGVLDVDLIFDATHGMQKSFSFGSGGVLNFNLEPYSTLGVGYLGIGTLRITDGIAVSSNIGYLGYNPGSQGTAFVTGTGSNWTSMNQLYIGFSGIGTMNIEAGGQVNNTSYYGCYLGYDAGSYGTATVTGIGSKWSSSKALVIGTSGSGTLNIEDGGQVSNTFGYLAQKLGSDGVVRVIGMGSKWTNSEDLYIGPNGIGSLNILDGGVVFAKKLYIYNQSILAIDVLTGSNLTLTNGIIRNDGTVRFFAGASPVANSSYSPISPAHWSGSGVYQALGGKWDATMHVFKISGVQAGDSGTAVTIDRLNTQRVLIEDGSSGWKLGASFLAATASAPMSFTTTAINDGTLDALRGTMGAGDVLLGGWTLAATSGYTAGEPVYLSFGDGVGGYADKNMHVWSYDGTKWSEITPDDLIFDGAYANFTTTALGCFAVTVPEPSAITLFILGVFGLLALGWRRRS